MVFAQNPIGLKQLPYSPSTINKIAKGQIFSKSEVDDFKSLDGKNFQKLDFSLAGIHKLSCLIAFRKLSLYEEYKKHLASVKESKYDDKTNFIYIHLSSALLPKDMILNFKIPRIRDVGIYPFFFDTGILKNLQGEIHVSQHGSRCLVFLKASWRGPHTGIPNIVFEIFSTTIGRNSMKGLFRFSSM